MKFPVQIQADNQDATDSTVRAMCHVFDVAGLTTLTNALSKQYPHVVGWDADGIQVFEFDNR